MTVVGRFLATGGGLEESEDLTWSFWIKAARSDEISPLDICLKRTRKHSTV